MNYNTPHPLEAHNRLSFA